MKIATILPLRHMSLEEDNDYHMALAHLCGDLNYVSFFRRHAERGDHVIMDNGIVEGAQQPQEVLLAAARALLATEMVLPDEIGDAVETLRRGSAFMEGLHPFSDSDIQFMAVPQGATEQDWSLCLQEMLTWPVRTIGFSKFIDLQLGVSRFDLLVRHRDLIQSYGKEIHLLGSPKGSQEVQQVERWYPGLVRGLDSGYVTFCTAADQPITYKGTRPTGVEKDFDFLTARLDEDRLIDNYATWRAWCLQEER